MRSFITTIKDLSIMNLTTPGPLAPVVPLPLFSYQQQKTDLTRSASREVLKSFGGPAL